MQDQNSIIEINDHPSYKVHCSFYFLYYASLGLFRPFIPSFLDSAGLTSQQIGNVFILISLATLISSPSWGRNADKFGTRSKYLLGFPIIAAVIMAPLILFPGYYQAIFIALIQGAFIVPLVPLADAVCLERCKQFGWKYGRIRLWGTIGFLATSSIGGFIAESAGWSVVMFIMLLIICLMSIGGYKLKASSLPKTTSEANQSHSSNEALSRRTLSLRPFLIMFLSGTVLYQAAFGTYNLFFGIHLENITHASKWISVAWSIATMSEILFFGIADSLMKKVGPVVIMGAAMLCAIVRWGVLSSTTFLPLILALQVLHGVMLGGFVTGAVTYSSKIFPSVFKTYAQGLHNAAYNGLGGVLAALICSYTFSKGGAHFAFIVSAILSMASVCCLVTCSLLENRQKQIFEREASENV